MAWVTRRERRRVDVEWIAIDPDSGRLPYVESRTNAEGYVARLEALALRGEGYSEVNLADQPYPRFALTFRGAYGVVHKFSSEDEVSLLVGNGVVSDDHTVLFPGLEGDTEISGEFVSNSDHAIDVVIAFVRSGSIAELGEWREL
jgi:hypothetical protein